MNSVPVVVVVTGNGGNVPVDTEKPVVGNVNVGGGTVGWVGSVNVGRPVGGIGENVGGLTVVVTNMSGARVLGGSGSGGNGGVSGGSAATAHPTNSTSFPFISLYNI